MACIGQVVSVYREEGRELDVTLTYPEESRQTIADLEDMKVATPRGAKVPLIELATFIETDGRSEEHTSELQSRGHLVCRLLLEKKKQATGARPKLEDRL